MNIKAQGLLNAVAWIESQYGRDVLGKIVRGCSPAVRDRYISAIAINWHPVEEFVEFLQVAERTTGETAGKLAEKVGAAGARANLSSAPARAAIYISNPEFLMRRITGIWSQFNDEGQMLLLDMSPRSVQIELSGIATTHPVFCATLTGWFLEVGSAMVQRQGVAKHTQCKGRGAARCLWEIRFDTDVLGPVGSYKMKAGSPP